MLLQTCVCCKMIAAVYSWAVKTKMLFNDTKFEMLRCSLSDVSLPSPEYQTPSGSIINNKREVKDLGITLSSSCSFSLHISNVVEKMKQKSSWICRTFASRSKMVMTHTWKSLVLPIHDYCCQLWCPRLIKDVQLLEQIQWNFLKKIIGSPSNYWEALKELNISSLQRRRERYLIFYVWKVLEDLVPPIINNHDGSKKLSNIFSSRNGRFCSVPSFAKRAKKSLQTLKENSFTVFGAQLFNALPPEIRNISSCKFGTFKSTVDKFLAEIPDEPHIGGYSMYRTGGLLSNSLLDFLNL